MVDLGQKRWKEFHLFYWNKVKEKQQKSREFQDLKFPAFLFNPESALDFVTKLDYSIKASAHGLFLMKE
jgi:hypothetical protein